MDPEKLPESSKETLVSSLRLAGESGNSEVNSLHLILALLSDQSGIVFQLFERLKLDISALKSDLKKQISLLPRIEEGIKPVLQ